MPVRTLLHKPYQAIGYTRRTLVQAAEITKRFSLREKKFTPRACSNPALLRPKSVTFNEFFSKQVPVFM